MDTPDDRGRGPGRAVRSGGQRGRGGRGRRGCSGLRNGRGRSREAEAAAVGDDDDADASASLGGGTPARPGGKELITYRRTHEHQRDSRVDGERAG